MTTRTRTDPRKNFVPRLLPWLVTAAAFALYWFTLNRWVSLSNLESVSRISGWAWQVEAMHPLTFLVTYPFRWLPASQIPLALNLFSTVCAALTLGLLARSVALLPHDRTDAQRKREHSDFSFLTLGSAWLPPVLAVLVCGLQMTFWENATSYTGEMFDLLLFAFLIWSLLEYRLDERDGRLFLASAVYGASMANNWAMVGFFPVFIGALVWIRGLSFFNLHFLRRITVCGLLGTVFYLLLPLLAVISAKVPVTFWEALKANLAPQYAVLRLYFLCLIHPQSYFLFLSVLLAYLMPVFVLSVRWKAAFGDHSQIGLTLTSFLFHVASATFLVICIWMGFDPPFSTRHLGLGLPGLLGGAPFLTFYYLGALSIGYFTGYFLLVFGKAPSSRLQSPRPEPFQFLDPLVVASIWALATVTVTGLVYRNAPQIRAINDDTFQKYASFAIKNLPASGGILLSDDSFRLFLVEAALVREGRAKNFIPVETQFLNWPFYLRLLHREFPLKWPELVSAQQANPVNSLGLIGVMTMLAKTNDLYYLHPSYGYYFEQFYQEPHGLVYQLKALPDDTLLPRLPDKNQIAANDAFWSQVETQVFASIQRAVTPRDPNAPRSRGEQWLDKFHVPREQNPNAFAAGIFYSRSLNFWGVQLQRAGDLTNAAVYFTRAQGFNPDNFVAQVNLQFNQSLRANKPVPLDLAKTSTDLFGRYHSWNQVVTANGPFDEPSFCFVEGFGLVRDNGLIRQAIASFMRVHELDPDNLTVRIWLGQLYVIARLPDRALEMLREPLDQPEKFSLAKTNTTELNVVAASAYFQKDDLAQGTRLLEIEIARHPTDQALLGAVAQAYLIHGLYTNALTLIDHQLRLTPDDPAWLFNKGFILTQFKAYDDAIAALSRVLAIQTNNDNARFNRAVAYLNSGRFDAAQADYKVLQQSFTNSFQIAYGLGDIAWRKHETNEAIRNYEIYLANASTNAGETAEVIRRLRELKGHSP